MAKKITGIKHPYYTRKLSPLQGANLYAHLKQQIQQADILTKDYEYYILVAIFPDFTLL